MNYEGKSSEFRETMHKERGGLGGMQLPLETPDFENQEMEMNQKNYNKSGSSKTVHYSNNMIPFKSNPRLSEASISPWQKGKQDFASSEIIFQEEKITGIPVELDSEDEDEEKEEEVEDDCFGDKPGKEVSGGGYRSKGSNLLDQQLQQNLIKMFGTLIPKQENEEKDPQKPEKRITEASTAIPATAKQNLGELTDDSEEVKHADFDITMRHSRDLHPCEQSLIVISDPARLRRHDNLGIFSICGFDISRAVVIELVHRVLAIYTDKTRNYLLICVDYNACSKVEVNMENPLKLTLKTPIKKKRKGIHIDLEFKSPEICEKWQKALFKVSLEHDDMIRYPKTNKRKSLFAKIRIPQSLLTFKGQTGDILLFQSKGKFRTYGTKSKFSFIIFVK